MVTEADWPRAFAWVVLDDSGDPARPSSSWRYRIDPLPGGGSTVRQRFTHGPGASYLRQPPAKAPNRATEIIAARRDGLRANMSATLRAMKAVAESSHGPASAQGNAHPGLADGAAARLVSGASGRCFAAARAQPRGAAGVAEPLTGRELEVLQLLAASRSNQRIAHVLVVAS